MVAWLTDRQARENMISKVCGRLHHAPGIARGADAGSFAGIGHKVVVPAVVTIQASAKPWAKMPHSRYLRKA